MAGIIHMGGAGCTRMRVHVHGQWLARVLAGVAYQDGHEASSSESTQANSLPIG